MSNTIMDKYAKMLELNRLRQKRFYEKNKNLISGSVRFQNGRFQNILF